jgi:hypothetical protein
VTDSERFICCIDGRNILEDNGTCNKREYSAKFADTALISAFCNRLIVP